MSFFKLFKIVFVIFFLYLLGDAFYRWDGFRYYGTFIEFIPAVALISVLWAILAIITSIILWVFLKATLRIGRYADLNLRIEHLIFCGLTFILIGTLTWKLKKVFYLNIRTTIETKILVFFIVLSCSIIVTFLFRKRTGEFIDTLSRRMTPLVWIFASLVFLSLPLIGYKMRWDYKTPLINVKSKTIQISDRPNIILITFDALSAKEMSLYGYEKKTTPFIDEWAKNAYVFTDVKSASNFTTPATASLMTGKRVWTHKVYQLEGSKPVNSEIESLPALLKKNNYFTMGFIVNPHTSVEVLGMSDSFDVAPLVIEFTESRSLFGWKFGTVETLLYRFFGDRIRLHNWLLQRNFILHRLINVISRNFSTTEAPVEKVFRSFLNFLDQDPPEPFFAWIHLFPPHDPYLPPKPYRGYFSQSDELRTYKKQEAIRMEAYKYTFQYKPFPEEMEPIVRHLREYYDEFIRYCDSKFKDFIMELQKRGIPEDTIIILSSDHGESFEHGYFTHGGPFLYEDVTNIPLIIKEPAQKEGRVFNDLVEQIDIPATILDYAGIDIPRWMEGRSLLPLIRGKDRTHKIAFSMVLEKNPVNGPITKGSVAIWNGDYKLIYYLEKDKPLLFNFKKDPKELKNYADEEPRTTQFLLNLIKDELKKANEKTKGGDESYSKNENFDVNISVRGKDEE